MLLLKHIRLIKSGSKTQRGCAEWVSQSYCPDSIESVLHVLYLESTLHYITWGLEKLLPYLLR